MSYFRTLFLFGFAFYLGDIAFAQHVILDTHFRSPHDNEISDVRVAANGDKVSVDVELSESVTPTLTFGENPDRLIADFPNVSPSHSLQHIPVGRNGVERVRIGLNYSSPPTTRVVVYLDSVRPVAVEASDRKVSLNILPALARWARAEAGPPEVREEGNATNIVEVSPTSLEPNFAPRVEPVVAQQGASRPATVGSKLKGIADTTPTAVSLTTTGSGVAASGPDRSSEPSRLRWILPVLTTSIILAMLVIALVSHIQNKRLRRGI
ncbi:MAG: AMIN domain-containing protein [Acidobacteriia bacterium]|nr:AMIN domain-containing protein [Terriglobia bacterium]